MTAYRLHHLAPVQKVLARLPTVPLVADEHPMCGAVPSYVHDVPTVRVTPFTDRHTAGRLLAQAMLHHARTDAIVLGLPNGGLAVAQAVASELKLALDLWMVRRVRPLDDPSLTLGVICEGPRLKIDRSRVTRSCMPVDAVRALVRATADQMLADARRLRRGRAPATLTDRTVILVDDGIASAAMLSVAIDGVKQRGAAMVVVASPVGARASVDRLNDEADDIVCLMTPDKIPSVAAWYESYQPVSDLAVMKILASGTSV